MTSDSVVTPAPEAPRYATAWAALLCALAALTLAHPALAGAFLVNPHSDQYIAGYAFREYAAEALRTTGSFPLWNPYLFSGMPFVDAMHGDIFYPTFLLRLILPTDVAMTWGMILHVWLAGFAAYGLFRAHKLPFHAALIGGLAYMMSGMIAGLVSPGHDGKLFVSALLPIAMLVLRLGVREGRGWAWGALAAVIGLGVLSPHPQLLQYLLLASGAYALWVAFFERGEGAPAPRVAGVRLGLALGAVALGLIIGAIQYLPVLNYVDWSPRAGGAGWEHAISYSMPPEEIINTFLPQFSGILDAYWGRNLIHFHSEYVGIAVMVLAAAAFGGRDVAHRRAVWFFTGLLIVSGLWALGGYTPFYTLVYHLVPGTKFFRAPSTMMYVTALAAAALAAFGAARVARGEVGRKFLIGAGASLAVLTLFSATGGWHTLFAGVVPQGAEGLFDATRDDVVLGAARMAFFGGAAVAVMFLAQQGTMSRALGLSALATILVADLWSVERRYWLFSPPAEHLYASDPAIEAIKADTVPGRVLAIQLMQGSRDPFLRGDALMSHGIRNVLGYHGNELGRYQELYGRRTLQGVINPNFWEAYNLRWLYTDAPQLPDVFPGFTRVLGPVQNAFGSSVYLYRAPNENPLAWVAPAIVSVPDAVAYASLSAPGFPLKSVAMFDTTAAVAAQDLSTPPEPLPINARTTRYEPGIIDIELDAPAPGRSALVVSENFYPGWTATVDGRAVEPSRANFTVIGVPLNEGARRIELRFTSPAFERGKLVTLLALLAAAIWAAAGTFLQRRRLSVA